ncbi:MAG: phosphoribosylaminoimidazolesuccinocarboxamide synthase [Acidobacteria bacterium]|nr:phosphoribosylaminoimidazolesuccinocarboxamide synthase [Acidobacteriota bacterium]
MPATARASRPARAQSRPARAGNRRCAGTARSGRRPPRRRSLSASGSACALSAIYYTAPTCCCCRQAAQPVRSGVQSRFASTSRLLVPLALPVLQTTLGSRRPDRRGKVRDIYEFGDRLVFVASDRISAFDFVLGSGIPDKGKVLTQISAFWFGRTKDIVGNHVLSTDPDTYPAAARAHAEQLRGRSMLVTRTQPLPIECVARGYLSGSGWKDYLSSGEVCGIRLPKGLKESDRLPEPIFTPATKAETGHDLNISEREAAAMISPALLARVKALTLQLYAEGAAFAEQRGIIVADTKFEFGLLPGGGPEETRVIVIDEMLTPDSSRFWPRDTYRPGGTQPSFDKQFVRDYLEQIAWNKQPPVPALPDEVIARTREKYIEAFRRLTGREIE